MGYRPRDSYDAVVATQNGELVQLLSWGLTHPDQMVSPMRFPDRGNRNSYFVSEIGRLGDESAVPTLKAFLSDPELAESVTNAIKAIRGR
jgi:hypothetical protein